MLRSLLYSRSQGRKEGEEKERAGERERIVGAIALIY